MSDGSGWQVGQNAPRHYHDQVSLFMQPFADALVDSVVTPGDAVLDVACGTGIATRSAAKSLGGLGRVVGTDINRAMIELAAILPEGDRIEWREASTLDLPYEYGTFDCVISQQGIQFFPDSSAGLAEMARVAKPGARVAVTVWSPLSESPYLEAMYEMLTRCCDANPDDMAWSSTSVQIATWFNDADLGEPVIQHHVRTVSLPPLDSFVPAHMMSTPWAKQFGNLPPDEAASAIRQMQQKLKRWSTTTGADIPFASFLATIAV